MGEKKSSSKRDILKEVPLFSKLSNKHLDELARIADEVTLPSGRVIVKQGERGLEFVFILEGEAKVERDGKEVNRLAPHDFFGEIALIDGRPRTASVTAETDVRLLVIHYQFFNRLLENVPGLQKEIMVNLCQYVRTGGPKAD